jgi:hypothetical protein
LPICQIPIWPFYFQTWLLSNFLSSQQGPWRTGNDPYWWSHLSARDAGFPWQHVPIQCFCQHFTVAVRVHMYHLSSVFSLHTQERVAHFSFTAAYTLKPGLLQLTFLNTFYVSGLFQVLLIQETHNSILQFSFRLQNIIQLFSWSFMIIVILFLN